MGFWGFGVLGLTYPSTMEGMEAIWADMASLRLVAYQGSGSEVIGSRAGSGSPPGGGRQGQAGSEARYWLSISLKE